MARAKRKIPTTAPSAPDGPNFTELRELGPAPRKPPHRSLMRSMFLLSHHCQAWMVKDGRLLPDLSKMTLRNGLSGACYYREHGTWDLRGLRSNLSRSGKYIIPLDVDAPVFQSYVVQPWPGYHVDRWTTLYEGSSDITFDREGYDLWRASLVDRGIVRPLRFPVLQKMLRIRERVVARLQGQAAGHARVMPDLESRIERLQTELEVVREALAETPRPEPGLEGLPVGMPDGDS